MGDWTWSINPFAVCNKGSMGYFTGALRMLSNRPGDASLFLDSRRASPSTNVLNRIELRVDR